MARLSRLTIGFSIYIVLSAAFMLQIRGALIDILGQDALGISFKIFFILSAVGFVFFVKIRYRINLSRLFVILVIFISAYFFAEAQPYFSEKTHVFTYGLLGYFVFKDLYCNRKNILRNMLFSFIFICLVSALDEIFQFFLPYRVGELRDFITNIIGALFGIVLFITSSRLLRWNTKKYS